MVGRAPLPRREGTARPRERAAGIRLDLAASGVGKDRAAQHLLAAAFPQGNLFDFLRLTEWRGPRVLYFGDHLYSDLAVRGLEEGQGVEMGWGLLPTSTEPRPTLLLPRPGSHAAARLAHGCHHP